ncbi:pentatricopeptide repeat-containing protein At3g24000, mitochondrial-like [Triticum dicoccoides]|uniref:pentatricopeptide repeat-containing protein At3g24000, mitochondrial-like n=1 Tax=Triticum dicoccoides TaxID=85692 RepID=UPI001891C033|nr:pentatricopeptide repeat-containing protein At3g24000, mitochondrial-like [Triticum dicoccoides]
MRKPHKLLPNYLLLYRHTRPYTSTAANPVAAASAVLRDLDLLDAGELAPTPRVYHSFITACAQSKNLEDARKIHAHLGSSRFAGDAFLDNSLIHMYCKCRSVLDARNVFDQMRRKDMVSWTSLIAGYAQNDMPVEAIGLLPGMLKGRFKPNGFTFASLLKAAGAYADSGTGRQIHALAVKCGWHEDVYVGSALLDMYARCGKMDMATAVFDKLDSKNGVSWNALISGFARKGDGESALMTFAEMLRNGFEATHFTYSSVFSSIARLGALEQGKWVHAHVIKSRQKLTAFVGNTLLDMYAKSGSMIDARKVFDRVDNKDLVTWNSMLTAFAQYGLGKEAVSHFEEMRKSGVYLNQITFLCILTACSHGGLVKEGKRYFEMMKEYDLEPEIDHYVTVVALLGRAGLLNYALVFIFKMPMEPTAAVWGALLAACRMHKNAKVGQFAADHVFELDPDDSGPPVLLYNIYASTGQWDAAARVRMMMKTTGVKKEPACSWVEMENSVHMFVANDDTHPQAEEIYKMWGEISKKIRKEGYVPDMDYVLLHVDDQEKEANLQYHSEKLALAFALIEMPAGATIRIMKNIRICGDCHSAFKYISKVFGREIVVRDTNRFHHFSSGSCSCGDYW